MDKEEWLKAKIAKIMAEGIDGKPVSNEQAVAVANSMWEQMQKEKTRMARMPIFPAKPCKAVDGRNVTQDHIDAILAYDASVRPAILKLDASDAHGSANGPALATIERTYADGAWIYGDVSAQSGYAELLPQLAGKSGPYPFRSIELDTLELNGEKRLYLESVALCGAQRPALDLPPAEFSKKQTYTICLTGGEPMSDEKKPDQTVDLAKLKSELEAEFAKKEAALREEFTKKQAETPEEKKPDEKYTGVVPIEKELANVKAEFAKRDSAKEERIADLEAKLLDKDLDMWSKSGKMLRKLPPFARANAVNIIKAAMEHKNTMSFAFAKGDPQEVPLGEAIKNLLESLPDTLIATRAIGEGLPTDFDVPMNKIEKERIALSKIRQYAAAKNIDLTTPDGWTKAEAGVKRENPDLWEVA